MSMVMDVKTGNGPWELNWHVISETRPLINGPL